MKCLQAPVSKHILHSRLGYDGNSRALQTKASCAGVVMQLDTNFEKFKEEKGAAAGVCFYDYSTEHNDLCMLFVRQKDRRSDAWTWPGGKRLTKSMSGSQHAMEPLRATAARETEEETHWQLPASRVGPMLETCPNVWWASGRYCIYIVHLPGEWGLAAAITNKAEANERHPKAQTLEGATWLPLQAILTSQKGSHGGFPLHRVPLGVLKGTKIKQWLRSEAQRLKVDDVSEFSGSDEEEAVQGLGLDLDQGEWGSSSHDRAANREGSEGASDRGREGASSRLPGSQSNCSLANLLPILEPISARKAAGNSSPILWPFGVAVSSPQLLPKPTRSLIPAANSSNKQQQSLRKQ